MHESERPEAPTNRSIERDAAYTVREVASLLGRSERWAWARVADGSIPSFKVRGARVVLGADLLACLQSARAAAGA